MGIVRSWIRGIIGASGVTLLVPLGLLAAVLVATTVGGSGLGAVGQLIGGPEVPGVQARAPSEERSLPTVPAGRATRGETAARGTASARRRAAAERRRNRERSGSGSTDSSTGSGGSTQTAPPPPPPAQTTPPPPPPAQPASERNPIRRLGQAVQDLVRPLPIVGPPVSDAVGTVIDLIAPPDGANPVKKLLGGQ